jgi:Cu+-exporting ATPase
MSANAAVLDAPTLPSSTTLCRHCGDACADGGITTAAGTFCCAGCESVFSLIAAHGMTSFYACDVAPGLSQRSVPPDQIDRYAVLDDADVQARLIESNAQGISRARFVLPDLHCASCVWLLEQLWRFDPGVVRSDVDLVRRTIRFEFRPARTSLRSIATRLASLGYAPLVDTERGAGRIPPARRTLYLRLGLAGFAFGNVMLFSIPRYANGGPLDPGFQRLFDTLNLVFTIPVLVYSAAPYFQSAWHAARARVMTLDVPIAIGLAALYLRSVLDITAGRGEGFLDSFSGLVFFLLIGRLFQQKAFDGIAFDRTVRSFLPLSVRVDRADSVRLVPIDQLAVGDVMVVRPHEVVPADAAVVDDEGAIDYAFVTGESTPAAVWQDDVVRAGGRVVDRAVRLRVIRPVSQSRLVSLWNDPVFARPKTYWLTDVSARFGGWFTAIALMLAVIGAVLWWPDTGRAVSVATAVLIIACPCALTLAAPITLGTAMGVLGRLGFYLKHPGVALDLSRVGVIVFDKTGTLTTAADASAMRGGLGDREWALARRLAAESVHPVSRALAGRRPAAGDVTGVLDVPGHGISGWVAGRRVAIGSAAFISTESGVTVPDVEGRTWIWVRGSAPGWVELSQPRRRDIGRAIRSLSRRYETWLVSGDHQSEAPRWSPLFDGRMRFRMSPEDKLGAIRHRQLRGDRVLMIGDGLNDAGAMAAADVGLAVSDETACLVPACDAVIRGDRVAQLPDLLAYLRRARRVVVLCFAVSIVYNVIGLGLALAGRLTPLTTAILMPVSSLTIVGLSVGLMRWRAPIDHEETA